MNNKIAARAKYLDEKQRMFEEVCHRHGMKITPQRVAIYKELTSSKRHPSAITIFRTIRKYYPNISLGTVNSTLLSFSRIGLAKIVESSGEPKRFDPDMEPHHHFKCIKCGRIIDFINDTYDNIAVPAEIKRKYVVTGKKVHLEGLCDKCRIKAKIGKEVFLPKRS